MNVVNLASSLALGAANYEWRDAALCRDTDPNLFFPVGTTGLAIEHITEAKQVCGECSVSKSCLDFALDTNQDSGVWGGLTEEERHVIRRQHAAAARSPASADHRRSCAGPTASHVARVVRVGRSGPAVGVRRSDRSSGSVARDLELDHRTVRCGPALDARSLEIGDRRRAHRDRAVAAPS